MTLTLDKDNPLATKVQTRDGRKARLLCLDAVGNYPIVALVWYEGREVPDSFTADGKLLVSDDDDCADSLINVPVEREYEKVAEFTEDGRIWNTASEAIETAAFNAGIDAALSWLKAQSGDDFLYAAKRIEGMKR